MGAFHSPCNVELGHTPKKAGLNISLALKPSVAFFFGTPKCCFFSPSLGFKQTFGSSDLNLCEQPCRAITSAAS